MSPSRLADRFAGRVGRTGLVPFVTAGYPSLAATLELMRCFDRVGALAIEVGVPFSEPIADGPDIQRATEHALRQGVGLGDVLALVAEFRRESELPVVLMTYTNPVVRMGEAAFAAAAREAGVDGVIVSDLPPEELPEVWRAFDDAGLDTILLVAPTTAPERARMLVARTRGFVYCLARTGVTGQGGGEGGPVAERIAELRAMTPLPIAVGFGISSGADAARLAGAADAVIVGAAFMRAVAADPGQQAVARCEALAREIIEALG